MIAACLPLVTTTTAAAAAIDPGASALQRSGTGPTVHAPLGATEADATRVAALAGAVVPETTIGVRPVEAWSSSVAFFSYSGTPAESIGSYECRLTLVPMQAGSFVPCPTAGREFAGLGDGTYRFEVRAISTDGIRDPTPASYLFTVDTVAPETLITAAPGSTIRVRTASFEYGGWPPADVAEIECRLTRDGDTPPSFEVCDPGGRTFGDLPDGFYTFEARARDAAGSVDTSPASHSFRVDTEAPETTIVAGPAGTIASSSATFSYVAEPAEAGDRFACRLVGPEDPDPAFAPCPDGTASYDHLSDGEHRFEVRAGDAAGNVDPTAAGRGFTVDTIAPTATVSAGPAETTTATTATFAYAAVPVDDVQRIECRLIGPGEEAPAFADCPPGGVTYEDLDPGAYRFELRAADAVGNVSDGVDWRFRVERAGPTDPGPTDPGPTDPEPGDPGPSAPGPADPPASGPSQPAGPPPASSPPAALPPGPPSALPAAGPPRISGLRLAPATFRPWTSGPSLGPWGRRATATGRGSLLTLRLDRAVRIELRVSRAKGRHWVRLKGSATGSTKAGTTRVAVRGRLGGKTLRVGRHRLTVVAIDRATGARTTKHLPFRIRR